MARQQLPRLPNGRTATPANILLTVDIRIKPDINKRLYNFSREVYFFLSRSNAEFGAYMSYSRILEQGGGYHRPRPHVRPAIFSHRKFITYTLGGWVYMKFIQVMRSNASVSMGEIEKTWERILNSLPKDHAIDSALNQKIWRFGFHVRSLHGYGQRRNVSDIKQQQEVANAKIRSLLSTGRVHQGNEKWRGRRKS